MSKRAYLLYALLLVGLLSGAALAVYLTWSQRVDIVHPARGRAVQAVYATGVVEPVHWAKVAPTVTGRLTEISARDGDKVQAGDVLARLDDREARALLQEFEAVQNFRREELERYARLARTSIASRQAFERAASDHAKAVAAVAAAKQRLRDLTLEAPMNGTVLRQDGEVGEVVDVNQTLFWIGRKRPLQIEAEVDEEDIPLVAAGQKTAINADAFPKRTLDGAVREITPKGDPINKNYRVHIDLPDDTPLLIGMTTEVNIIVRTSENALLVPTGALNGDHIWLVENGYAAQRAVTVGIRGQHKSEITAGLAEQDQIIVDPPQNLAVGDRLRINETGKGE